MAHTQSRHSTSDDWFEADCARRYAAEDERWNSRHVAMEGWSVEWTTGKSGTVMPPVECVFLQQPLYDLNAGAQLREKAEVHRVEFDALSRKWTRETKHLSLISKKITHPAFLRIVGMGEPVIPLILEALRDRPAHWFVALRATANADPVPAGANPSEAREAWLAWGRSRGYID